MLRAKGTQSVSKASTKGQSAGAPAVVSVDQVASRISDFRPNGIAAMVPRAALLNFRIARAIGMIELDYSIPQLNLDLISQHVGLTKCYLCRIFKRELGIGLPQYVSKVRAQAAAELLRETCLSIKEITAAVGLTHVTQLDRAFRVTYGCVPKEYRSRISARDLSRSL